MKSRLLPTVLSSIAGFLIIVGATVLESHGGGIGALLRGHFSSPGLLATDVAVLGALGVFQFALVQSGEIRRMRTEHENQLNAMIASSESLDKLNAELEKNNEEYVAQLTGLAIEKKTQEETYVNEIQHVSEQAFLALQAQVEAHTRQMEAINLAMQYHRAEIKLVRQEMRGFQSRLEALGTSEAKPSAETWERSVERALPEIPVEAEPVRRPETNGHTEIKPVLDPLAGQARVPHTSIGKQFDDPPRAALVEEPFLPSSRNGHSHFTPFPTKLRVYEEPTPTPELFVPEPIVEPRAETATFGTAGVSPEESPVASAMETVVTLPVESMEVESAAEPDAFLEDSRLPTVAPVTVEPIEADMPAQTESAEADVFTTGETIDVEVLPSPPAATPPEEKKQKPLPVSAWYLKI